MNRYAIYHRLEDSGYDLDEIMIECQDGDYVKYDEASAEIAARDSEIERLKAQLAACAAGPWREPTEEEQKWINQCEYFENIELTAYDQEKIVHQQHIHAPLYIADINPPEATQ